MMGMIQSLNVSVACAVSLFEAVRQRMAKGCYDTPTLSPEEMDRMQKEWTVKEQEKQKR
jgi:tRNA (guanosine-2'-O-)-methyltransferase